MHQLVSTSLFSFSSCITKTNAYPAYGSVPTTSEAGTDYFASELSSSPHVKTEQVAITTEPVSVAVYPISGTELESHSPPSRAQAEPAPDKETESHLSFNLSEEHPESFPENLPNSVAAESEFSPASAAPKNTFLSPASPVNNAFAIDSAIDSDIEASSSYSNIAPSEAISNHLDEAPNSPSIKHLQDSTFQGLHPRAVEPSIFNNEAEEDQSHLFGNEDNESSFLASLGTSRLEEASSLLEEPLKGPSTTALIDKKDEFAAILGSSVPPKKSRPQSTAFLFDGGVGGDDSFFQGLSSVQTKESHDFLSSLGEEPDVKAPQLTDEDAFSKLLAEDIVEQKSEPSPKPDLSKSLAFLLDEDDELLPENYAEPQKSGSSVIPVNQAPVSKVMKGSSPKFAKSLQRQASFASNTSGTSSSYSPYPSLTQQVPQLPQVPPKGPLKSAVNNAFDLPTDMVPKTLRRMASFQSAQQNFPFGIQSNAGPPKPTLNTKKSFFEELPPIPRKPMSRKTSTISLHQEALPPMGMYGIGSHTNISSTPLGGPPIAGPPIAGPPIAGPHIGGLVGAPTGMQYGEHKSLPMAPPSSRTQQYQGRPRAYSKNSSGEGSSSQYLPSSPGSAYKPHNPYEVQPLLNTASRTSSPYNMYETPISQTAPPLNPYSPQVQARSQIPAQNPYASQPGANSNISNYSPTSAIYPQQPRTNSPAAALQPSPRLSGNNSFGDMPADLSQRHPFTPVQNSYMPSPTVQDYPQLAQSVHHSPPQARSSFSSNRAHTPSVTDMSPKKALTAAPLNNEALLRRQFPIFRWGINGKAVTLIPPSISFGGGAVSSEVKILPVSQILRLDEHFVKFPFSIVTSKGSQKNKKKDLEKWIEDHIAESEAKLKSVRSEDLSRHSDRVVLWKIMLSLLQAESSTSKPNKPLMEAVRKILDPFAQAQTTEESETFAPAVDIYQKSLNRRTSIVDNGPSRNLKPDDINRMVDLLKVGQRENAMKYALDQHLWGHALVLASSLGSTHWIDAVFEMVREEVRVFPSQSARDMALMYRTFSGAGEDSGRFSYFYFNFY